MTNIIAKILRGRERYFKFFIQLFLGIVVLIVLFSKAGGENALRNISSIDPLLASLAAVTFIIASTLVGLTLFIALRLIHTNASILDSIMSSFSGQLVSDVSPARLGYFLTPFILNKRNGTPIESGMVGVTLTGVVNFFVKALLAIFAILYFTQRVCLEAWIVNSLVFGTLLLGIGGIGLAVLLWSDCAAHIVRKIVEFPLIGKFASNIIVVFEGFQKEAIRAKRAVLPAALLITFSFIAGAWGVYFISLSLSIEKLSLLDCVFIHSLVNVFMYVPFTVAGLGIQESAYVILSTILGVPLDLALSLAVIVRILFTVTDVIGLPFLLTAGIKTVCEWSEKVYEKGRI